MRPLMQRWVAGPAAAVVNEGGKLFLTSKQEIPVHAVRRSDMLQGLQASAGHTQALPFGRAAFEDWMNSDPPGFDLSAHGQTSYRTYRHVLLIAAQQNMACVHWHICDVMLCMCRLCRIVGSYWTCKKDCVLGWADNDLSPPQHRHSWRCNKSGTYPCTSLQATCYRWQTLCMMRGA